MKRAPAHPNCRCAMVPYIDLGPKYDVNRAAEVKNFDKDAEEAYNEARDAKIAAGKNPGKEWDELAFDTRRNKRYEAIREYESKNGAGTAYRQVKSSEKYEEYFSTLDAKDQREWLGATRYRAYKSGDLPFAELIQTDGGYVRSLAVLREIGMVPAPISSGSQSGGMPASAGGTGEAKTKNAAVVDAVEDSPANTETPRTAKEFVERFETSAADINERLRTAYDKEERLTEERAKLQAEKKKWTDNAGRATDKAKFAELKKKLKKNQAELEKTRDEQYAIKDERGRRAIQTLFPNATENSQQRQDMVKAAENHTHKSVREAADVMGQVVDSIPYKPEKELKIKVATTDRSVYGGTDNIVYVTDTNDEVSTVFGTSCHEFSHWIDQNNPELREKLYQVYEILTKGSDAIPIPDVQDELYRPARIPMPNPYCTRDYVSEKLKELNEDPDFQSQSEAHKDVNIFIAQQRYSYTELLSEFFSELTHDPVRLATKYEEYFDIILETLQ